ncbi:calcium-binding protein [Rhizobium sp. LjRoot254]
MAIEKLDYSALPMTTATANTTYVLDADEHRSVGSGYMIELAATQGLKFQLNGSLYSGGVLFDYGAPGQTAPAIRVNVGSTAYMESESGAFLLYGDGSVIHNEGTIASTSGVAVGMSGAGIGVENEGTLLSFSTYAVMLSGSDLHFENSGTIGGGISISSTTGSTSTIINSGLINSASVAVLAGNGDDTIINSGLIRTSVGMGNGDDRFIDKGGDVTSAILGGGGDDLFVIKSGDFDLRESNGSGFDTVKSYVSWEIGQDFEVGRLLGSKNINLTASDDGAFLYGNAGNNKLTGRAGVDKLDGGRGNDILTGAANEDHFVFKAGSGKDVIVDFIDGADSIDLQDYKGIDAFGDLGIKQDGKDLVIELQGGDTITLRNFDKTDLSGADFAF